MTKALLHKMFLEHPHDTEVPQSYWLHGWCAFRDGVCMIFFGSLAVIHAFLPFLFPFYISRFVFRLYNVLVMDGRFWREMREIQGPEYEAMGRARYNKTHVLCPLHLRRKRGKGYVGF